MSPVPSRMVAKHSFPALRDSITRPVTPTRSPVAAPAGWSGYLSRTSAIVWVRGKVTGYGSVPSASSRSRLPSRTRTCSGVSAECWSSSTPARLPARRHGQYGFLDGSAAGEVPLEHQAQADQRQPGLVRVDHADLAEHERGQPAGRDDGHRVRILGRQFRDHPPGNALDLAGKTEDDPGLERLDRVL